MSATLQALAFNPYTNAQYDLSAVPTDARWDVRIDGALPNAQVVETSNGESRVQGQTDASGHFEQVTSLVGAMGSWNTVWSVGGVPVGSYHINVIAATAPASTSTALVPVAPTPAVQPATPAAASPGIPTWALLLAAAGVALWLFSRE